MQNALVKCPLAFCV